MQFITRKTQCPAVWEPQYYFHFPSKSSLITFKVITFHSPTFFLLMEYMRWQSMIKISLCFSYLTSFQNNLKLKMTRMLIFEHFPYPCFPFIPLVCAVARASETTGAVPCTESLCWTDLPWFAGSWINFFIFDSGRWRKSLKLTKDQNFLFVGEQLTMSVVWFVLKLPFCKCTHK